MQSCERDPSVPGNGSCQQTEVGVHEVVLMTWLLFKCLPFVDCLQGPLPNTCGHFWEMVWEQKSRGVVMLNRVMEKGSVSPSRALILPPVS